MKIVFMGTPEFAVPILGGLLSEGYDVSAVYCRPDSAAGRGRTFISPPVKRLAEERGLAVVQPRSLRGQEAQNELRRIGPDVVVVAAYGLILPQVVLDIPRLGCLNVHASLLPRHRGAAPISAAIAAGDRFTGVSIMHMDAGIDTGPVYSRSTIPILNWDTTGTLTRRLSEVGSMALLDVLPQIERDSIIAHPQPETGATYAPQLSKEAGRIDWSLSALALWRHIRAFQPWPGAFTTWEGKSIKILETTPLDIECTANPGTVIGVAPDKGIPIGICTGRGVLGIGTLQLEGKKAVSSADFLRGQRNFPGSRLG